MPIYEYRCAGCGGKSSIFYRSIAVAEANPACPRCSARQLERLMSRVWSRRSDNDIAQPTFEDEGVPFYGPDPYADPFGGDGLPGEYGDPGDESEPDAAAMAREAREMARMMGEPLDAEFESALRHVERGADPDEVFGELDAVEHAREETTGGDP